MKYLSAESVYNSLTSKDISTLKSLGIKKVRKDIYHCFLVLDPNDNGKVPTQFVPSAHSEVGSIHIGDEYHHLTNGEGTVHYMLTFIDGKTAIAGITN